MLPNDFNLTPHFKLSEFADRSHDNLVIVHPLLVQRLELLRTALCNEFKADIAIIISCGTRTTRSNNRLAKLLGWTDADGAVSRDSQHLPTHFGAAADIFAVNHLTTARVPHNTLALLAWSFFDVVIDHYPTHIHVDLRDSIDSKGNSLNDPEP